MLSAADSTGGLGAGGDDAAKPGSVGAGAGAESAVRAASAVAAAEGVPCNAGNAACIRQRHALHTRPARKRFVSLIAAEVWRVSIVASSLPSSSIEWKVCTCGIASGWPS